MALLLFVSCSLAVKVVNDEWAWGTEWEEHLAAMNLQFRHVSILFAEPARRGAVLHSIVRELTTGGWNEARVIGGYSHRSEQYGANGRICEEYVDSTAIPQLTAIADCVNTHAGLRLLGGYMPWHTDTEDEEFEGVGARVVTHVGTWQFRGDCDFQELTERLNANKLKKCSMGLGLC